MRPNNSDENSIVQIVCFRENILCKINLRLCLILKCFFFIEASFAFHIMNVQIMFCSVKGC